MDTRAHVAESVDHLLETSIHAALEHYANVHRGTGHSSLISTELYERARQIVLDFLRLGTKHVVIFCTPWRMVEILGQLRRRAPVRILSSRDLGLPVGVRALVVRKSDLPKGAPLTPGGGTVKMVSQKSVDWASAPDRFEPGTPNIIGVIAFARALELAGPARYLGYLRHEKASTTPKQILHKDSFGHLTGRRLLDALRTTLIGREVRVPTAAGPRPAIHFDNGASTPTFEPIWQAVRQTWRLDEAGKGELVAEARTIMHDFFGAPAQTYDLIFTANTTEAIAVAAEGLRSLVEDGTVIVNTMLEHNSDELPWRYLPGVTLARLSVDREGFVDLVELEDLLRAYNQEHRHGRKRVRLVCVCGASNVMGTYNDLQAIARLAHQYGAKLLVDAAQLAAHRPVRMAEDGIDLLAFSAHKMYAPFGSGGLIAAKGILGFSPQQRRTITTSGEENVAGIAALGKATDLLTRIGMDTVMQEEHELTRYALERLAEIPGLALYGVTDVRAPRFARKGGVLTFELQGIPHNLLARQLAEQGGISVRSGCFCVNMYVKQLLGVGAIKNVMARAGLALMPRTMQKLMVGLVRVSFGLSNQPAEIDRLAETLLAISREDLGPANRLLAKHHIGTPFMPQTPITREITQLVTHKKDHIFSPSGMA